jgi:hypothetical protein
LPRLQQSAAFAELDVPFQKEILQSDPQSSIGEQEMTEITLKLDELCNLQEQFVGKGQETNGRSFELAWFVHASALERGYQ